jgi:large subunit ribosomal protein L22
MASKYSFQEYDAQKMARAIGRDLELSTKQAIEISKYLKHRKTSQAKNMLERTIELKFAIPYTRYTNGVGHRAGKMASGAYPVKASKQILKLIKSAESNAQSKGLGKNLEIIHMNANKAVRQAHHGRSGGRAFKRTHVEIVVAEAVTKKTEEKK